MPVDPLNVPSNNEIEAATLLERADKKANQFNFFGLTGSKSSQFEDAADMCTKAGNLFKIEKKWKEAGDAYVKSVDFLMRLDDRDEAANKLVEASKCYRKSSPNDAVQVLQQAIELLKERGRFHPAAGHQKTLAEIFESDIVDLEKAMKHYEDAADLYSGEDSGGLANQCWLKVATFAAQLEQYDKAIEKFEHVATTSLDNNLTKYSAKGYFLNAALCHMCRDIPSARKNLERYQDLDPTFSQSREYLFVKNMLDSFDEGDVGKFTGYVAEYDRMTKLDAWKTTILLRIKKQIADEEGGLTPHEGRFLVANCAVDENQHILEALPYSSVICEEFRREVCWNCFRYSSRTRANVKCGNGCKVVRYCSDECRGKDWVNGHSAACEYLQLLEVHFKRDQRGSFIPCPSERDLMRLAVISMGRRRLDKQDGQKGRQSEIGVSSRLQTDKVIPTWSDMMQLQTNKGAYKEYPGLPRYSLMYPYIKEAGLTSDIITQTLFDDVMFREVANSFGLWDSVDGDASDTSDLLGYAIYPLAAYFNHSCRPTVRKQRIGRSMVFSTISHVDASDRLTISYGCVDQPFEERQQRLSDNYYFRCLCERCIEDVEIPLK